MLFPSNGHPIIMLPIILTLLIVHHVYPTTALPASAVAPPTQYTSKPPISGTSTYIDTVHFFVYHVDALTVGSFKTTETAHQCFVKNRGSEHQYFPTRTAESVRRLLLAPLRKVAGKVDIERRVSHNGGVSLKLVARQK
jgi:hypothetical protein